MAHWEFGPPQRGPTVWLLEQFRGLADALRVIHNLSDTTILRAQAQLTVPATRNIAWHHDLKPDNFLFFSTQDSPQLNRKAGEGIISIADFGSGKVHTFRPSPTGSINTRSPNGTPTYESPETRVASSRPSDVWSLGCVFLELLVWALFDYEAVKDFSIRRQGRRNLRDSTGIEDNAFWQEPEQGGAELRQAVEDQMDILKDEIDRKRKIPFSEVLDLIKKMLHINPQQRVDAVHVWNALDRIYNQADGPFWTMDEDDQETLLLRLSTHIPAYLPPCSQPFEPLSKLDSISPLKFFSPLKRRRTDGGNSSLSRRSDVS